MVHRIYVEKKEALRQEAASIKSELCSVLGIAGLTGVRLINRYDVELADEAAIRRAVDMLSPGGEVKRPVGSLPWSPCCAEVVDRFGVWWYLTVEQHQPDDSFDPDTCPNE